MPTSTETPLFLTCGNRPVYAVLYAPGRERPGAPALVLCHGLGVEHMVAYRCETQLARAAAAAGFPVIRFHARGHGDSAGDFADVTLDSLAEDALAAAAEVRARSGATRAVWAGTRFGALVAAEALRRDGGAAGLVLWEPVHRSMDYARSLLRGLVFSQVSHGREATVSLDDLPAMLEREGRVDVQGYYLHHRVVQSAADRDLAARLAGWAGPTLLVQLQARRKLTAPHQALVTALGSQGAATTTVLVHEEVGWSFFSNPPWLAEEPVTRTVEWLDALA